MLLSLWRRTFYFSLSSLSNLGAKTASSSVRWMWLSSTPGGSWSVTLTSLTVPNSRRGQHSPCGGGRSLSPWATPLPTVAAGVVELLFLFALACQSSCILTRISRFRLWASFLRIWLRSFSFTNSDSNDIWRFFCCCPHIRGGATGPVCSALLLPFGVIFTLFGPHNTHRVPP